MTTRTAYASLCQLPNKLREVTQSVRIHLITLNSLFATCLLRALQTSTRSFSLRCFCVGLERSGTIATGRCNNKFNFFVDRRLQYERYVPQVRAPKFQLATLTKPFQVVSGPQNNINQQPPTTNQASRAENNANNYGSNNIQSSFAQLSFSPLPGFVQKVS
jgi:hypothetical protein